MVLAAGYANAQLVINEFLADPEGADAGAEFVELFNTGSEAMDLLGVCLEFANGSVGPEWEPRWCCEETRFLPAGGFFLLVDRNWRTTPVFDAQASLGLQNGPDAIRLVRGEQVLDLVGYGSLTDPAMMEIRPVPLPTGQGLGRRPDGRDTDDNAADFQPVDISPGTRNFADHAFDLAALALDPPCLAGPGNRLRMDVRLRNIGLLDHPATTLSVRLVSAVEGDHLLLETPFGGCPVDGSWDARLEGVPPQAGRFQLILELDATTTSPALSLSLGGYQIGPGALEFREVLHLPGLGQGEWIELAARRELHTENFQFRDEDGDWRALPARRLLAQDRLVAAQDSVALAAWQQDIDGRGIPQECGRAGLLEALRQQADGWPNLNNSPPAGREHADRLYLADSLGVVIDQVTLPADGEGGAERGTSWERSGSGGQTVWRPGLAPAGSTPGCPNSVAASPRGSGNLSAEPRQLDPAGGVDLVHLLFTVPEGATSWHLEIYDLWGERVRDLGGRSATPGPGDVIWDGRTDGGAPAPAGAYVVVLLLALGEGPASPARRTLVVVR